LIAFSEEGIRNIVAPGLRLHLAGNAEDAIAMFDTKEERAAFKLAMLVIDNQGHVFPGCSGCHSESHPEANHPIGRFI
jgi:hypothetical protein